VPFHEPDFEFWSLNDAYHIFPIQQGQVNGHPRMVWFETHPREWFTGPNRPPGHLEWLQKCPIPIYMWEHQPDIPNSVPYPLEEMCTLFRGATARWDRVVDPATGQLVPKLSRQHGYLTSSIAYMMALAISQLRDGDELWCWGVDLAAETEYLRQRPCVEYLLGYAEGKGIRVALPSACPVLQGAFYGRDDPRDQIHQTVRQKMEMLWQRTAMEKRQTEQRAVWLAGKANAYEEMRAQWPER